jgi:curli biogenesis system outer membrane secretion channel CsgG
VDVGKGVAELFVDELRTRGQGEIRVVERTLLDAVIKEQDLASSDRADQGSTAARLGKLMVVQYLVTGSVTKFGGEEKDVNAGALGALTGRFFLGQLGMKKTTAHVALTARLIDSTTGEIVGTALGEGESARRGLLLAGMGIGGGGGLSGNTSLTSKDFQETILGEATLNAVRDGAMRLLGSLRHGLP